MFNIRSLINNKLVLSDTTTDHVYDKKRKISLSTVIDGVENALKSIGEITKTLYAYNIASLVYDHISVLARSDSQIGAIYTCQMRFTASEDVAPYTVIASGFPAPLVPNVPVLIIDNSVSGNDIKGIITAQGTLMVINATLTTSHNLTISVTYTLANPVNS